MNNTIKNQLLDIIENLSEEQQLNVLEYLKVLMINNKKGISGKELLKYQDSICKEDIKIIKNTIKEDCRKVDFGEW